MEDSSGRKDRLPVLFSADSADSNKPQSIEIVAARAIENKRKLIDLCDRWIAPIRTGAAVGANTDPEPTGGDLGLTSRRGGALAGMMAAGAQVLRLLI